MRHQYIKICPSCGSTEVKIPPAGMDLKMTQRDFCVKCGTVGTFPEVKLNEAKNFKKKIRR